MSAPTDELPARMLAGTELDDVLRGLGDTLADYRGRRILITGGTGFFGRWLLESLRHANRHAALGARMVVLTRDPTAFAAAAPHLAHDPAILLHRGDIRDFDPPAGAFDYVLHAAATTDARAYARDPLAMLDTIVSGTRRVVDLVVERGVARMLFVSSGAVYGAQPSALPRIPEDHAGAPDPLQAGTVYAHAKRLAEHICAIASEGSDVVIPVARCFAFVGPHLPLDAHFAVGNFVRDALAGGPIRVAGDGTPYRSYLYGSDLACWLLTILARGQSRRAYNVGSDAAVTIAELASLVASIAGAEVTIAHPPTAGMRAMRYVPDVTRARSELQLEVRVALDAAIRATLAFYRGR
jgi:nucleoside-diphosphate-sugar epimerase